MGESSWAALDALAERYEGNASRAAEEAILERCRALGIAVQEEGPAAR